MIRKATSEDLPRLAPCAEAFYASSKFLNGFDLERFCALWSHFIRENMGVVFILESDDGEALGALGGMRSSDLYSGELYAGEMFWFVKDGHRGVGLKLYHAFEQWARDRDCRQIRMVHLADSMPEKLERVYKHLGFEKIETQYGKSLE